jgi:transposase-like protein
VAKIIPKYEEDFKKSIVSLYQNGKTQSELSREYEIPKDIGDPKGRFLRSKKS